MLSAITHLPAAPRATPHARLGPWIRAVTLRDPPDVVKLRVAGAAHMLGSRDATAPHQQLGPAVPRTLSRGDDRLPRIGAAPCLCHRRIPRGRKGLLRDG